jgi:hypothetical protein
LWLIGLGVGVHFNAPRCPQQNGVIEQSNGSAQRWVDLKRCPDVTFAQAELDACDLVQREHMPYAHGQSRMAIFPELASSGRNYSRSWEEQMWEFSRAQEELERYRPRRSVSKQGRITLYYRSIFVGIGLAGSEVVLSYDHSTNMWSIERLNGRGVRAVPAVEMQREAIMNLTACDEAKAKRGRKRKN